MYVRTVQNRGIAQGVGVGGGERGYRPKPAVASLRPEARQATAQPMRCGTCKPPEGGGTEARRHGEAGGAAVPTSRTMQVWPAVAGLCAARARRGVRLLLFWFWYTGSRPGRRPCGIRSRPYLLTAVKPTSLHPRQRHAKQPAPAQDFVKMQTKHNVCHPLPESTGSISNHFKPQNHTGSSLSQRRPPQCDQLAAKSYPYGLHLPRGTASRTTPSCTHNSSFLSAARNNKSNMPPFPAPCSQDR